MHARLVRGLAAATALALSALVPVAQADDHPPVETAPGGGIVVRVHGLRSDRGSVRCKLFDSADGFPERAHVIATVRVVPSGREAVCAFAAPARGGQYAVVIHHDENDDDVFQRGIFGVPLEGYGFSNNVRPVLSAPSFAACSFRYAGGASGLDVSARY